MTQIQIFEKLDAMLSDEKTKNFLTHLVRSYLPISNVDKVWSKPKSGFKCVITGNELFSVEDVISGIKTDEFRVDFMNNLKSIFDEKFDKNLPLAKLINERKLGVTGKNTTTFMSYDAMTEFHNWVLTKALMDDKYINWLLRSINGIKNKNVKVEKQIKKTKQTTATYSLGDLDAFKKIKELIDNENKN